MRANPAGRIAVLASADISLRGRIAESLRSMRWQVREASGGAEALAHVEEQLPEALLVDRWLPDLEVTAFEEQVRHFYPQIDLLRFDGEAHPGGLRSLRRHELLHALREASQGASEDGVFATKPNPASQEPERSDAPLPQRGSPAARAAHLPARAASTAAAIPGIIGQSAPMLELARLIRLVAPHDARVLIEGETGTGKELVAKALHALSGRAQKPFVVLNCAAIPEALLEAELFGHTRGAFTGAVQARTGRIEAAHGGTLFLDEIGEMPLPLQAKLLRFLENGELQRIGDNEPLRVDVRVLAATHQNLEERAEQGSFRLDLFHRLSVFPIDLPSLRERIEDIPLLAEHFLAQMARTSPRKYLTAAALEKLCTHAWPGNVRELGHVLQRAAILADQHAEIDATEILVRRSPRR